MITAIGPSFAPVIVLIALMAVLGNLHRIDLNE